MNGGAAGSAPGQQPIGIFREPDGGPVPDIPRGKGTRSWGPYILSGAWWRSSADQAIQRRYYFLETSDGDRLWVYYDGRRHRWFLQGKVE